MTSDIEIDLRAIRDFAKVIEVTASDLKKYVFRVYPEEESDFSQELDEHLDWEQTEGNKSTKDIYIVIKVTP